MSGPIRECLGCGHYKPAAVVTEYGMTGGLCYDCRALCEPRRGPCKNDDSCFCGVDLRPACVSSRPTTLRGKLERLVAATVRAKAELDEQEDARRAIFPADLGGAGAAIVNSGGKTYVVYIDRGLSNVVVEPASDLR